MAAGSLDETAGGSGTSLRAERWAAVVRRDTRADGEFVYAVTTTGVYCRPSCGARRPFPEHVVFFDDPAAARAAGYRACRRCRPDHVGEQQLLVAKVIELLREAETPPTLEELASALGVSPHYVHRVFRRITGLTPKQAGDALRAARLEEALGRVETVTDALWEAGYGSIRALYANLSKDLGIAPSAYRRGGAGEIIFYTVASSPLGPMLLARTARGICALGWGEEGDSLSDLRRRFPRASLERDDEGLRPLVQAINRHLSEGGPLSDIPIDARGSEFQRRVWDALREIPYGETRTYTEIARRIGMPQAVRAVARACASNPIALLIPCHRILRSDGCLAGYRWGVERKAALVAAERSGRPAAKDESGQGPAKGLEQGPASAV